MFTFPDIFSFNFVARFLETINAVFAGITDLFALFGVIL